MNECPSDIVFLVVIAGRGLKEELLDALAEAGGRLLNTVYCRGSVKSTYLMDLLGFVPEAEKVMITCLIKNENSDPILGMLIEKFHFDKPNTGVAFTVPIETLSY